MRVLWFGSYSKGPGYPRSETLISGLRELGHDVVEVHVPLFEGAPDRVALGAGRGAARMAWRQAMAAVRLAARYFRAGDHDVAVAGAGGVADAALLRFLQNFDRVPLVVDEFIPLYDTVVRDRRLAAPDSGRARMLLRAERFSARVADVVLSDTSAQADLLATDLGIDREGRRRAGGAAGPGAAAAAAGGRAAPRTARRHVHPAARRGHRRRGRGTSRGRRRLDPDRRRGAGSRGDRAARRERRWT